MRRLLALLVVILLPLVPVAGRAESGGAPPVIAARAYLLMDSASGQVLYAYEGETPLPMASTTKIMTAILALERSQPTDIVTAGQKPYDTGGSTIYLDLGEKQPMQNLLYALMLESANDAAVAIAEHLAGTEEQFAVSRSRPFWADCSVFRPTRAPVARFGLGSTKKGTSLLGTGYGSIYLS
ncbi:MAG TPA: serine hydrolase, partial [Symbiobacteriaceae bacterium]|nr:serine hydrolase [Symbiobacteriaceae bacterium]